MELSTARCSKGHRHRVWLDGRTVYVEVGWTRRRCGTAASGALHAMQIALSFLASICGVR